MAKIGFTFNVADAPKDEYAPLPSGEYVAIITESEMKENNKKNGSYIQLKIEIQEGEYSGRTLFERLNVQNPNEVAVNIAFKTLAKICEAIGKEAVEDTEELHNKRFVISLEVEEGKPYPDKVTGEMKQGNPQNVIKGYKPLSAGVQSAQSVASTGAQSTPPWKR